MKRHPLFYLWFAILVILSTSVCLASESYDNLHIYYTGNRITGVLEDADYLDNIDPPTPYLPDPIGPGDFQIAGMTKFEYHGPVIYRDGYVSMVRFPGGFATVKGSAVTFHYYTQDYLGNNRAVVNGSTGEIEQTVAYYPYGAVIADLGISTLNQPFKFGGKELTTQNGLNEYDFGARQYYPAVPGFTSVDPLCEKTPDLSPYLYCGNNPVNAVDPTGKVFETLWDIGNVIYDVGAAAYNHITGNHEQAASHWIDAGLDVGAMLIPGIPAGVSKIGKVAKATDKASDAGKGLKNAEAISDGRKIEIDELQKAIDSGENVTSQVHLVPQNGKGNIKGNRTVTDQLIKNDNGTFSIVEVKRSSNSRLSKGQKAAKDHVNKGDGVFEVRSNLRFPAKST